MGPIRIRKLPPKELEAALQNGLEEEIVMLRKGIEKVFDFVEEAEDDKTLIRSLGALGLAATRLARLVKTETEIKGAANSTTSAITAAIDQTIKDLRAKGFDV